MAATANKVKFDKEKLYNQLLGMVPEFELLDADLSLNKLDGHQCNKKTHSVYTCDFGCKKAHHIYGYTGLIRDLCYRDRPYSSSSDSGICFTNSELTNEHLPIIFQIIENTQYCIPNLWLDGRQKFQIEQFRPHFLKMLKNDPAPVLSFSLPYAFKDDKEIRDAWFSIAVANPKRVINFISTELITIEDPDGGFSRQVQRKETLSLSSYQAMTAAAETVAAPAFVAFSAAGNASSGSAGQQATAPAPILHSSSGSGGVPSAGDVPAAKKDPQNPNSSGGKKALL